MHFWSLLTTVDFQVAITNSSSAHREDEVPEHLTTSPSLSLENTTAPDIPSQDPVNDTSFPCALYDPWMSSVYYPDCETFTWLEIVFLDLWKGRILMQGCHFSPLSLCFLYFCCRLPALCDALLCRGHVAGVCGPTGTGPPHQSLLVQQPLCSAI